ncbi:MAG: NCS2 family permease [Deltaproteobacteria bacterium]|nr:NCS2 family permease [Deltaproteobacteria bacterium]
MLERLFGLTEAGTTVRAEVLGGLTTFVTMAYIIVVNPAILTAAGIPQGPSMVATVLTAVIGTLAMGLWANRPFAIAPYMGENAFIAYTVTGTMGYSWQTALAAILIGGILFVALTATGLRATLANAIPASLKYSFAVGIGLFLALIGLAHMGVVTYGMAPSGPLLRLGTLGDTTTIIGIVTFLVMAALTIRRVPGTILGAMLGGTVLAMLLGAAELPGAVVSMPPSLAPILFQIDFSAALTFGFLHVALVVFVMDFVDTMGTLIGVSARAGFLDDEGNLPQIERPMMADALATVAAALLGTTTAGTFIESAAGVEAGGRTGLTAVVCALLFLLALFFTPVLTAIPEYAWGPALVLVGILMLSAVRHIPFDRMEELVPAFAVIVLMPFTYNIGIGMTAGFILFPLFMAVAGRVREVKPGMWALTAMSLLLLGGV